MMDLHVLMVINICFFILRPTMTVLAIFVFVNLRCWKAMFLIGTTIHLDLVG